MHYPKPVKVGVKKQCRYPLKISDTHQASCTVLMNKDDDIEIYFLGPLMVSQLSQILDAITPPEVRTITPPEVRTLQIKKP